MRLFVSILVILWSGLTQAGTIDPGTPDDKYVEFGKSFPFVVQISNAIDCKNCGKVHAQLASAVAIKPNWVLTAAHVVKDAQNNEIIIGEKRHPLPHVVWHKDYDENKYGFNDIAICYSPEDFKLDFYVPLYRKTDELGKAVTIAGWGSTGTFVSGAKTIDGKRRAGHSRLSAAHNSVVLCTPSRPKRFPLEFMIAPGDSGGGMFIGNELAGINSFLTAEDKKPDGTYTDESAFTRISLYIGWIESQIEKHENTLLGRATLNPELP